MITEDEVMRLLERADPARHVDAAPAVDAAGYLDALRTRSTTVTLIDTEPTPTRPPRRHRWLIITAAAAVVAVVVGGLVLAVRDDTTEPQIPAGPSTVAPDSAAAEAELVARSLFEAENAYDADRALTYLSDEYIAAEFGTPEQYRLHLSFSEAVRDKTLNIDCEQQGESAAGIVLRCTYDYHSFRSHEIGRGPYTGDYKDLTIRDGKIVAVEAHHEGLTSGFSTQMWEPFANWVAAEHPDDVLKMYEDATRTGWRITEESIPLWEQHLREYVEAENGGVGFIGLPPEGATPSTPERGELVVGHWWGGNRVYVYDDGRLIWLRYGNPRSTGYLEQHLTPEGVELVRSDVVSSGLFVEDLDVNVRGGGPCVSWISVRDGDRVVRVSFTRCGSSSSPAATPDQAVALRLLDERLRDVDSWLPDSAWEDREIRAYVASRYSVCYEADILTLLPAAIEELLPQSTQTGAERCADLTTEEARTLAEALDDAGFEQDGRWSGQGLAYAVEEPDASGAADPIDISFTPYLPHGEAPCLDCG